MTPRIVVLAVGTAAATLAACASQGAPPGGPPDVRAPAIVRLVPDSGRTNVRPARVIFQFDEVVNERPQGQPLAASVLVSPSHGAVDVSWDRDAIRVRAARGWRPNTVYTVTLLPGIADLRGNARKRGATIVFSTGGPIPSTRLVGVVFDLAEARPAPRALVQAIARPDSVLYLAQTDSSGRFSFAHLPPGTYTVRAFADANTNRVLDPREAYDSASVTVGDSTAVELYAFVHDTLGPRIETVTQADSLTLRVKFDKPLDAAQSIDVARFTILGADSVPVPLRSARGVRALEAARDSARADSAPPPAAPLVPLPVRRPPRRVVADSGELEDTLPPLPTPVSGRAPPEREVELVLGRPLAAGSPYRVRAIEIRNLIGRARSSERAILTPRPVVADTSAAARDSTSPPRPRPLPTTQAPAPSPPPPSPPSPPMSATPRRPGTSP